MPRLSQAWKAVVLFPRAKKNVLIYTKSMVRTILRFLPLVEKPYFEDHVKTIGKWHIVSR